MTGCPVVGPSLFVPTRQEDDPNRTEAVVSAVQGQPFSGC